MHLKIYFNTGSHSKLFELIKSSELQSACKSRQDQAKLRYAIAIGKGPAVLP